jgi:membrane-bound metal-dependent hydrolase YbcI (DUF457 family)
MLAVNHATLATAAAFGYSLYFDKPFFLPLILFVVFAGVFPDIDHPGSELGKMFKPVGMLLPHRGFHLSLDFWWDFWDLFARKDFTQTHQPNRRNDAQLCVA